MVSVCLSVCLSIQISSFSLNLLHWNVASTYIHPTQLVKARQVGMNGWMQWKWDQLDDGLLLLLLYTVKYKVLKRNIYVTASDFYSSVAHK